MFLLPIGVIVFSLQCISLIGFHPLFFIIKPLLSCFMVRSLIIILLGCLVVSVLHPHWLITGLNLILEPSNVFSWVILLLLKVTNDLIYILEGFLFQGMFLFMSQFFPFTLFHFQLCLLPLILYLRSVLLIPHLYLLMILFHILRFILILLV